MGDRWAIPQHSDRETEAAGERKAKQASQTLASSIGSATWEPGQVSLAVLLEYRRSGEPIWLGAEAHSSQPLWTPLLTTPPAPTPARFWGLG